MLTETFYKFKKIVIDEICPLLPEKEATAVLRHLQTAESRPFATVKWAYCYPISSIVWDVQSRVSECLFGELYSELAVIFMNEKFSFLGIVFEKDTYNEFETRFVFYTPD